MPAVTRHPQLLLCQAGSSVLSGDTGPEEGRQTVMATTALREHC